MKSKDPVVQHCWDWARWCETRHLYIPSRSHSTLGVLLPSSKKGREPNARNDPDMQYFNMAVHMLADIKEHQDDWLAFQHYYCMPAQVVKVTADKLGIGVRTYYDRVKRFGKRAFSLAPSIKVQHERLMKDAQSASTSRSSSADED
jgi:hypothetical protein